MKNLKNLSLGEGNTPLIRLFNLEKKIKWQGELWAKCEYQNPTGSFKDRGSIAEITRAIEQNKNGVVCASTGNMAASLAAYAARARLSCWVVLPKNTAVGKTRQARISGARLVEIEGNYDRCVFEAEKLAETEDALLCGDYATRRRGQRSLGIELARSGKSFDAFLVPVGNGTLGCAICEGLAQERQFPRFIGLQGQGADPIFQAWKYDSLITPISNPTTIASAMNVGNPLDGNLAIDWVTKTNGLLFSVSDSEIINGQNLLASTEGIYAEKAAAATLAMLPKLPHQVKNIVLILTGSGLKES